MILTEDRVKELLRTDFKLLIEENKEFFFNLFHEYIIEMIEDKGMLNALKEINEEDNKEVDENELNAIFNGEFIDKN